MLLSGNFCVIEMLIIFMKFLGNTNWTFVNLHDMMQKIGGVSYFILCLRIIFWLSSYKIIIKSLCCRECCRLITCLYCFLIWQTRNAYCMVFWNIKFIRLNYEVLTQYRDSSFRNCTIFHFITLLFLQPEYLKFTRRFYPSLYLEYLLLR